MRQPASSPNAQAGFTLVELIMVIVILGIVSSMVTVFMRGPIDAYLAAARRAALTDVADTVLRRIERDLRKALPNSIRTPVAQAGQCLQFIPTKTGGRYRADGSAAALNFDIADTSFNMLGPNSALPDQAIVQGDVVVVYNLGPSVPEADAYQNANTSIVSSVGATSAGETPINIDAKQFPLESGGNRFHVVPAGERVVSYVCSGGALYRKVTSSGFVADCTVAGPKIADRVSCNFDYSGDDLSRNALVRMVMQMQNSAGNESVQLQQEVHVSNTP
jgi:MSHA biogenesis protein MshO